ncbi:hypothetical protein [Shimia ponticola]|uniref:hypothetical protein n=1 Tax=Shimia ponticola TaxID=2582893 RepID=UPI0011BF6ADE|nr:hypothetical protein [Shimia ponticola]
MPRLSEPTITTQRAEGRDYLMIKGMLSRSHYFKDHAFRWLDPQTLRVDLSTAQWRPDFDPPEMRTMENSAPSRGTGVDPDFLQPRRPEPVNRAPLMPREIRIDLGPAVARTVSVNVYLDGQIEYKGRVDLG